MMSGDFLKARDISFKEIYLIERVTSSSGGALLHKIFILILLSSAAGLFFKQPASLPVLRILHLHLFLLLHQVRYLRFRKPC